MPAPPPPVMDTPCVWCTASPRRGRSLPAQVVVLGGGVRCRGTPAMCDVHPFYGRNCCSRGECLCVVAASVMSHPHRVWASPLVGVDTPVWEDALLMSQCAALVRSLCCVDEAASCCRQPFYGRNCSPRRGCSADVAQGALVPEPLVCQCPRG